MKPGSSLPHADLYMQLKLRYIDSLLSNVASPKKVEISTNLPFYYYDGVIFRPIVYKIYS